MKRVIALLLVLMMVFGLAACGGNTPANNTPANNTPANDTPANNAAAEVKLPKNVTVYVPQKVGSMVDQTSRIMVDYLKEVCPDTKFTIENTDSNGNEQAKAVVEAPGDGSAIFMIGPGTIALYYNQEWDYNLADQSKFVALCANVGQEQPSGGVFLVNANETRFHDIPSMIQWIKDNPGQLRCSWGTGTPHEIRLKLILDYFGITSDMVIWNPGPTTEVRAWIQGGNTDVAVMTEATAAADIKGGKVKGILNSVCNRNLYTPDLEPLKDVPIVPEVEGVKAEDAEKLICAWPMTIYAPASTSPEIVQYYNDLCKGILNYPQYVERMHAAGSTTTYQVFTVEEINAYTQLADKQIKEMYERFK